MGVIHFQSVNEVKIPFAKEKKKYKQWLQAIATQEDSTIIAINYIFCDDAYLLQINQQYLQHDDLTDIITFPYQEGKTIESDIFISIERTVENAATFQVEPIIELRRVMAHGLLHLLGYGDKTPSLAKIMRTKEEESLVLFNQL